jgi:hypothetical protein
VELEERIRPAGKRFAGFSTALAERREGEDGTAELVATDGTEDPTNRMLEGVVVELRPLVEGVPSMLGGGPHFWLTQPPVW